VGAGSIASLGYQLHDLCFQITPITHQGKQIVARVHVCV